MSQLEAIKKLDAYRVVEHKMIEEMQSEGIVLEHKKTKARLFWYPMMTRTRYSVSDSARRRTMTADCRIFWSTACSAAPISSR